MNVESLEKIAVREGFLSTAFTAKATVKKKAQGGDNKETREPVKVVSFQYNLLIRTILIEIMLQLFIKIMPCDQEDHYEYLGDTGTLVCKHRHSVLLALIPQRSLVRASPKRDST